MNVEVYVVTGAIPGDMGIVSRVVTIILLFLVDIFKGVHSFLVVVGAILLELIV